LTLDLWTAARLAAELDKALAGARLQGLSSRRDGLQLACYRRGGPVTLEASLDPQQPLLAALSGAPDNTASSAGNEKGAGGWAGGVAPLLRGSTVESVQAVPNDRIVFVDLSSRSAFGVPARHRLAFELEPLKANALVLRPRGDDQWQILAAHKQVHGQSGSRDVLVGEGYVLPPPRTVRRDPASFAIAVDGDSTPEPRIIARLLGEVDPLCSTPLGREAVERALAHDDGRPLSQRVLDAWYALRHDVERAAADPISPVYVWLRGEAIAVCHLLPLTWPPGEPTVASSFNDVCVRQMTLRERQRHAPAAAALRKRLTTLLERCDVQIAVLQRSQRAADEANAFRAAGEAIYTNIADIPERADEFVTSEGLRVELDPTLSAKDNAASYFKRFKKARSGLPRIAERLRTLEANHSYWEQLLWEIDRAESGTTSELASVCNEIGEAIAPRRTATGSSTAAKRDRPRPVQRERTVELAGGAIAYVGKSPKDNERVTFTVAGPNDLWFHARGIPGAHVVLKPANAREAPTDEQILGAAALAAGQSRAADAAKVEVDYTLRKYVRKQGKGRIGLVWYTDFKTVLVTPRKLA
jgi:predicted ribosome quality control (RQC) complex YloA/Tae2 family protein